MKLFAHSENQNQRIKQINAKAQKVQSEDLQNALNNPENSEMTF